MNKQISRQAFDFLTQWQQWTPFSYTDADLFTQKKPYEEDLKNNLKNEEDFDLQEEDFDLQEEDSCSHLISK